jgi:hypothetical protein
MYKRQIFDDDWFGGPPKHLSDLVYLDLKKEKKEILIFYLDSNWILIIIFNESLALGFMFVFDFFFAEFRRD